jgi:hypothetical protein
MCSLLKIESKRLKESNPSAVLLLLLLMEGAMVTLLLR